MFNRNIPRRRMTDYFRLPVICLVCMIYTEQFATAQGFLIRAESVNTVTEQRLARIGSSVGGERIVSVTCDPFMSSSQEQTLISMLLEQNDEPWLNLSLKQLKDRLSNVCNVFINEKLLEEERLSLDEPLMKEVPIGILGARLSVLLANNHLAYTVRQNRLEVMSRKGNDSGIRRIYDVTPLVRTVRNGPGAPMSVLAYPLVQIIESTVSADCWQSAGGNCSICEFIPPGSSDCVCLIILNSTENHLAIQNLLDHLNSFGTASRPAEIGRKKPVQASQLKGLQVDRLDFGKF